MDRREFVGAAALLLPATWFRQESEGNRQVWVTQDGRRVRIVDMTDSHLRNTIFYLQRRAGQCVQRGKCPTEITPADYWPIYRAMVAEATRRRLSWM